MRSKAPPRRPPLVRAEVVKRYSLAIVDDDTGQITRIGRIPEPLVDRVARLLRQALPTLRKAAELRTFLANIGIGGK